MSRTEPNKTIETIEDYLAIINEQKEDKDSDVFYRGQTQFRKGREIWDVSPSAFREDYPDEYEIYNLIMTECAHEIENGATHLDILCKMQHYQVPTRLLDITKNALVALFFACVDFDGSINEECNGKVCLIKANKKHIKVYDSDTVSILASIPRFNKDDREKIKKAAEKYDKDCTKKHRCPSSSLNVEPECIKCIRNFNDNQYDLDGAVHRLLHEIKKEKPAFLDEINPCHILNSCIVVPQKKNPRIISQDGAFVLFGQRYKKLGSKDEQPDDKIHIIKEIIVDKDYKFELSKQLELYHGISLKKMCPEMYKVAEYQIQKHKRDKNQHSEQTKGRYCSSPLLLPENPDFNTALRDRTSDRNLFSGKIRGAFKINWR